MAGSTANSAPSMLGVLWAELGLAAMSLALRYYTRLKISRALGWDDHVMMAALALSFAGHAMLVTAVAHGFGHHAAALQKQDLARALMFENVAQPLLVMGLLVARVSITILLIRFFPTKKRLRSFLIWLTVINAISSIIPVTLPFTCHPIQKQWDESINGNCPNPEIQVGFAITKAGLSTITDLVTALWPILIIRKLQMRRRLKAALGVIFGLSLLAMVSSIVEACFLSRLGSKSDMPYDLPTVFIWIGTQCNLVIIVGSIPTLRPWFQKTFRQSRPNASSNFSHFIKSHSRRMHKLTAQDDDGDDRNVLQFMPETRTFTNIVAAAEDSQKRSQENNELRRESEEFVTLPAGKSGAASSQMPSGPEATSAIHVLTNFNVTYENQ